MNVKQRAIVAAALVATAGLARAADRPNANPWSADDPPPPILADEPSPAVPQLTPPGPATGPTSSTLPKWQYSVFNPVPREQMREFVTDRPDVTESPITVDAGHLQVELGFAEYDHNAFRGLRTDTISVAQTNLKLGLLNNLDVEFVFTPYVNQRQRLQAVGSNRAQGFSDDTEIRLKTNFWGNDGPTPGLGDTAIGFLPFIKLPTGSGDLSNHHVEGGLIFPLAFSLPAGFDVGTEIETDFTYDAVTGGYGVDFVHTLTVGHDLPFIKGLGGYLEYVGTAPKGTGGSYRAVASFGISYVANENLIFDAGGTAGLSKAADDFSVFTGVSFRL